MRKEVKGRIYSISLIFFFLTFVAFSYFGSVPPSTQGIFSGLIAILPACIIAVLVSTVSRFATTVYLVVCWFLFNLVVIANWWHYSYFQLYFNYEFFRFGLSGGVESLNSLESMVYVNESIKLAAASFFFLVLILIGYNKKNIDTKKAYIISSFLFIVFAYAGFAFASFSGKLKAVNNFTLSPFYLHPVHAVFVGSSSTVSPVDENDWHKFKRWNASLTDQQGKRLVDGVPVKKYNVILLVLESFRASMTGYYGGANGLTPNFDRIAAENIVFKHFYASSNYTLKSETAMWCGVYDNNVKLPFAEYEKGIDLNCLPRWLKKLGYDSYYFHAYKSKFYSRDTFVKQVGFDYTYFHADNVSTKSDEKDYIGWGLSDEAMYKIILEQLEARVSEAPFFVDFMSLTSHAPFSNSWPINMPNKTSISGVKGDKLYKNYENAIFYDDYALGKFWEQFSRSKLYKNTIVFITGDHGIWSFEGEDEMGVFEKDQSFFRMPLVVYHPENRKHAEVDQVGSHIDIPITVYNLLTEDPLEISSQLLGKDLFAPVERPWSIMMKGGLISLRLKEELCLVDMECAGPQQACTSRFSPRAFDLSESVRCAILAGGSISETGVAKNSKDNYEMVRSAFGAINVENNRAIKKLTINH